MESSTSNPSSSGEEIVTALHNERATHVIGDRFSPKSEYHFHDLLADVHTETPIKSEKHHAKYYAETNGNINVEGGELNSLADVLSAEEVHVPIREERRHNTVASSKRAQANWKKGRLAMRTISSWTAEHANNYDEEKAERKQSKADFFNALDVHEDPSDVVLKEVKADRILMLQQSDNMQSLDKDHLACLSLSLGKVDRHASTGQLFLTCHREVTKGNPIREEEIKQRIRETDGVKDSETQKTSRKKSCSVC